MWLASNYIWRKGDKNEAIMERSVLKESFAPGGYAFLKCLRTTTTAAELSATSIHLKYRRHQLIMHKLIGVGTELVRTTQYSNGKKATVYQIDRAIRYERDTRENKFLHSWRKGEETD